MTKPPEGGSDSTTVFSASPDRTCWSAPTGLDVTPAAIAGVTAAVGNTGAAYRMPAVGGPGASAAGGGTPYIGAVAGHVSQGRRVASVNPGVNELGARVHAKLF